MAKVRFESSAVYHGSRLHTHRRDGQPWYIAGAVLTGWGYVEVYAQGFDGKDPHTAVRFIWKGREYTRKVDQLLTERGIATVARRFAGEVVDGKHV